MQTRPKLLHYGLSWPISGAFANPNCALAGRDCSIQTVCWEGWKAEIIHLPCELLSLIRYCVSYICNCRQRKAQNVLLNVCVYLQGPFLISGKKSVLRPCWNAQDANAQLGRPEFLPVLEEFCFHCDLCTEANLLCFCMVWLHLKSAAQSWLHR